MGGSSDASCLASGFAGAGRLAGAAAVASVSVAGAFAAALSPSPGNSVLGFGASEGVAAFGRPAPPQAGPDEPFCSRNTGLGSRAAITVPPCSMEHLQESLLKWESFSELYLAGTQVLMIGNFAEGTLWGVIWRFDCKMYAALLRQGFSRTNQD